MPLQSKFQFSCIEFLHQKYCTILPNLQHQLQHVQPDQNKFDNVVFNDMVIISESAWSQ